MVMSMIRTGNIPRLLAGGPLRKSIFCYTVNLTDFFHRGYHGGYIKPRHSPPALSSRKKSLHRSNGYTSGLFALQGYAENGKCSRLFIDNL